MGLSALVLAKKNSNINLSDIIRAIKEISPGTNFVYNEERYNAKKYLQSVCGYINDGGFKENGDRTIMFDIYDEKFYEGPNYITLDTIPDIKKSQEFFRIIIVDDFL